MSVLQHLHLFYNFPILSLQLSDFLVIGLLLRSLVGLTCGCQLLDLRMRFHMSILQQVHLSSELINFLSLAITQADIRLSDSPHCDLRFQICNVPSQDLQLLVFVSNCGLARLQLHLQLLQLLPCMRVLRFFTHAVPFFGFELLQGQTCSFHLCDRLHNLHMVLFNLLHGGPIIQSSLTGFNLTLQIRNAVVQALYLLFSLYG
mmetsp:Transcript_63128/g.104258  ORF Transcript_63128/g.104258 Transcript_63128/m.104258 type:complete len:203 (+) Transcript_63128:5246-5854(+)